MLQKIARYGWFVILLTGVWIIFSERLDLVTVVFGLLGSVVALLATNRLVLKGSYADRYTFRPLRVLWYGVRLLGAIYVAGFQALRLMLNRGVNVGIVDITTQLQDPFAVALLANSITLTPGTVTLSLEGENLKVIWLDCHTTDPELAGAEIKGPFERLLSGAIG